MERDLLLRKLESLRRCVERIDWNIVFDIATTRLEDFRSFARAVLAAL